jgi:hypothetical protein
MFIEYSNCEALRDESGAEFASSASGTSAVWQLRRNEYHVLLARRWPQIESLLKTNKLVNVYSDRLEGIG